MTKLVKNLMWQSAADGITSPYRGHIDVVRVVVAVFVITRKVYYFFQHSRIMYFLVDFGSDGQSLATESCQIIYFVYN